VLEDSGCGFCSATLKYVVAETWSLATGSATVESHVVNIILQTNCNAFGTDTQFFSNGICLRLAAIPRPSSLNLATIFQRVEEKTYYNENMSRTPIINKNGEQLSRRKGLCHHQRTAAGFGDCIRSDTSGACCPGQHLLGYQCS